MKLNAQLNPTNRATRALIAIVVGLVFVASEFPIAGGERNVLAQTTQHTTP